jgi:hypothetical protein
MLLISSSNVMHCFFPLFVRKSLFIVFYKNLTSLVVSITVYSFQIERYLLKILLYFSELSVLAIILSKFQVCWCRLGNMAEALLCVLQIDSLTIYSTSGKQARIGSVVI